MKNIDYDKLAENFLEDLEPEKEFNLFGYFIEFIGAITWILGGLLCLPFFFLFTKRGEEEEENE